MGRKSRKRCRLSNRKIIEDKFVPDDDEENYEEMIQQYENYKIKIILDIQNNMIDYTDKMGLPLCEYLSYDAIKKFIDG